MSRFFSRREQSAPNDESAVDAYPGGPRAPERPPLPRPEGLNRNALTIAAVIMGTIVLAAVVFVQPSRPIATATTRQAAPSLEQGTFLDQPPAQSTGSAPPNAAGDRGPTDSLPASPRPEAGSADGRAPAFDSPYSQAVPLSRDEINDARMEAYQAALTAPVRSSDTDIADFDRFTTAVAATNETLNQHLTPGLAETAGPLSSGQIRSPRSASTLEARPATRVSIDSAIPGFALQAGTLLPAVLITAINSDLPGEVLAQISRDVYDSRLQRIILIPRGSKLIGAYEDQVPVGQNRLLVAWTRLLLPDGRSVALPGLETKDRAGAGGVSDQVDRHARRTFGTTALLSLIGAGLQLSQPKAAIVGGAYFPSAGQVAAAAVGQQLAEVATQLLKRDLDTRPTIRIRQGMSFNVFLNTDLVFENPYDQGR